MSHARLALSLLTATDDEKPEETARKLGELNHTRQVTEKEILTDIERYLQDYPDVLEKNSLVLAHTGWHGGLVGIVAAKLVDRYFKPVILFSERNGVCKGSARSIPGFNLFDGLNRCATLLEKFGGHSMAAGLTLKKENLDRFWETFDADVQTWTDPVDFKPVLRIDHTIDFHAIDDRLLYDLDRLHPFGTDNREPLLSARNVIIHASSVVGKTHRRMRLIQKTGIKSQAFDAIYFNAGADYSAPGALHEIAFRLQWNRWNGKQKPQLVIEDMRPQPQPEGRP